MWSEMKNKHYGIFYLTVSFAVQNFIDTYVDSSTSCSENSVQNSNYEENFLIILRNKIRKSFHKYSVSNILSGIETQKPPQDDFSPVINSGVTPPINMGTKFKIPYGDILPIPSGDLSKIPEDTYATFYKSASSTPTNPKVPLVEPDTTTYVNSNSDSTSKTTITPPINLSDSKIRQ